MDGDLDLNSCWLRAMRDGDFATAWDVSDRVLEWRRRSGRWERDQPLHLRPLWDGTPLAGRAVLVRCHHGLGDSIQFARYVPHLARLARSVTLQAQPALLPLLRTLPGLARLVSLDEPEPPHEVAIESMELAHALRTSLATIPAELPYLRVEAPVRRAAEDGLSVGIAWRGGDWDARRAIEPEALRPLAGLPAINWVNLQYGGDSEAVARRLGFAEPSPPGESILATAQRIAGIDLVIAIDSMVAHLAGAIGRPVWLLLHSDCDWRWMQNRDDSPWYPTMRLFRQSCAGDWSAPIAAIGAALRERAAVRGAARRYRDRASPP